MLAHAAGDDAAVMREVGIDIEGDAMEGHPVAHAHADGGDLALATARLGDPDADSPGPALAVEVEERERADEPLLEPLDVAPEVGAAALQVQHDVADALAGPMIGVLPAPARAIDREEPGIDQVRGLGAGPGRVERWVLQQPDQLRRTAGADRRDALLHRRYRLLIWHRGVADPPLDVDRLAHAHCLASPPILLCR